MESPTRQHLSILLRTVEPELAKTLRYEARLLSLRVKGLSYWGAIELFYQLGCFLNLALDDST